MFTERLQASKRQGIDLEGAHISSRSSSEWHPSAGQSLEPEHRKRPGERHELYPGALYGKREQSESHDRAQGHPVPHPLSELRLW